jgi:hypothetical protein
MQNPLRKRKLLCIALACVVGVVIYVMASSAMYDPKKEAPIWIDHWTTTFRQCHSLDDIHALSKQVRFEIYTRTFSDGSWVAAANEWNCTDGAGFDAAVFYDSTGRVMTDTSHHFCGGEGLYAECNRVSATSLHDFYAGLPCKFTESH